MGRCSGNTEGEMMWIRFVANGEAAADEELRRLVADLRGRNVKVDVRPTWEDGDGHRLAREAAREGVDLVVACGGDGTLHEVVNGVMKEDKSPVLAGLPYGTGNDFLSALGIEGGPRQFGRWLDTSPRQIDLGRVGDHYFLNMMTVGVGAEVTAEASQPMKSAVGSLAYFLRAIPAALQRETFDVSVESPDLQWEGESAFLFVGNGPQAGGGWRLCPAAMLDDGLLDLVLVPEMPWTEILGGVRELVDAEQPGDYGGILYRQSDRLELRFAQEVPMNLDGEPRPARELDVVVEPGAIRFLVPESL